MQIILIAITYYQPLIIPKDNKQLKELFKKMKLNSLLIYMQQVRIVS